ncbi:MAG: Wzz/FepE/Etk N-terminal domain-containing protein, partial [Acidimicrobiia bacterium]
MEPLRPRDIDDIAALEQPSIIAAMWRYRWLVLLVVAIFIALGVVFQAVVPAGFQATAEIVVEDPRTSGLFSPSEVQRTNSTPQRYVADQVEILRGSRVAGAASEYARDVESVEISSDEFLAKASISSSRESNQIKVSFTADTADRARIGANSMVEAYRSVRTDELRATANAAVQQIGLEEDNLNVTLDELRLEIANIQAS